MSWLTDTALYTGLLIALVLVLRRPVARAFGPGTAYALWALPLLRLLLPPIVLPAKPASDVIMIATTALAEAPQVPMPATAWTAAPLLQAVWLAGALVFFAWRVWSYVAMRRCLLAGAEHVGRIGRVRLVETPATTSPVAFGVFDKVIALPPHFMAGGDHTTRDLAIAHELQHHAGHDLAVNIAMQPLLALHWFNPLAWAGWRALRRDQEAACDARVLAGRDAETRATYARLITSFAKGPRLALAAPMACPMLGEKSIIHRLRSLTMTEPTKYNRLIGRLLIGAGIVALPLTASVVYAESDEPALPAAPDAPLPPAAPDAPQVEKRVETRVIVIKHDGKDGDQVIKMGDEAGLTTRTVTRGGRTYVFKTTKPLSDAEVDKRVAEAEQAMPPMPPVAPGAPAQPRQVRTIVMKHGDHGMEAMSMAGPDMAMADCSGGHPTKVDSDQMVEGKHQVVKIVMCNKGGDKAHQLSALRSARDQVAGDANIPAEARANALKQIDEQIAKLD